MKSHANRVLDSIKRSLAEHLPKEGRALLFGSQARGDAQVDSDWDILILLNKEKLEPSDYDEVSFPLTMLGCNRKRPVPGPVIYKDQFKFFFYRFTEYFFQTGVQFLQRMF